MMDTDTLSRELETLVAAVEGHRADGLSAAAACRAAGVSTSTYYRRRRATSAAHAPEPARARPAERSWPYPPSTPRAPFYWDQVFADEMSDSFVRREFGAGLRSRAKGALAAIVSPTASPALARLLAGARRFSRRIGAGTLGKLVAPALAVALLALLVVTAGWMVSVAADPAAWLSHPDPAKMAANVAAPLTR